MAEGPEDASETPVTMVSEALAAEAAGDFLRRQRLLKDAGEHEAAKWLDGKIMDGRKWLSVDDSIAAAKSDRRLKAYLLRRDGVADDAENHLALARWCSSNGLVDQSRSHLERVITLEPDNLAVRRALGYQRMGSEWISPHELQRIEDATEFAKDSRRKYKATMKRLYTQLGSKRPATRELALETLARLQTPDAVPCLEEVLSSSDASPVFLQSGLAALAKIDTVAASKSLSRFAVFHPDAKTRSLATNYLSDRPLHDFVPDLLQLLESPASIMMTPTFDSNGKFRGYEQAFTKERMNKTDRLVVNRQFNPQDVNLRLRIQGEVSADDIEDAIEEAAEEMEEAAREAAEEDAARRKQLAEAENRYIEERNARVGQVVSRVGGAPASRKPLDLWKWWDKYNETNYQEYKPTTNRVDSERFAFRTYDIEVDRSCECFVAGTKVVTNLGNRPIEQLNVGDMVLSRNVGTGELGWKPVLRATNRPPELTVEVRTEQDVLRCTSGHLFWVSGKGWQKASELEAGYVLHAAKEPTIVASVRRMPMARTFNLQVADNATYFVGEDRVLTHDVTPRSHNRQAVPGEHYLKKLS
ncbi:MAG: polymorphic toxin-type HINT domain-containing protein, partial [Planctomycetota bacterium]